MDPIVFRLRSSDPTAMDDYADLIQRLRTYDTVSIPEQVPQPFTGADLIVTLGSAGVFTGVYHVISQFLQRHQKSEVDIQCGKKRATIKGYSAPDARILLEKVLADDQAG